MRPYPGTAFFGTFKNGQIFDDFWVGMQNGGFLHGKADKNGLLSGENIMYVYPDGETTFKGTFKNRIMKSAYHVDIKKYKINENGMLKASALTEKLSDQEYFYEPCTNTSFGGGFTDQIDPYEVTLYIHYDL